MIDYREDARWTVYVHIVPREISGYDHDKYYVGITSQTLKQRWRTNGKGYERNTLFYKAIQKYGWDNLQHEVIATNLTHDEACDFEKKIIKELNANHRDYGYNTTLGGEGTCGFSGWFKGKHWSPEMRQKLSEAHKGQTKTEEQRKNMSLAMHKRWAEDGDLRKRMTGENNPNYGKHDLFKERVG